MLVRQAGASFLAVLVCYFIYAFLAVPLIEPGLEDRAQATATQEQIESARGDVTARQREAAQYFAPGDWETDKPAIWRSRELRLLFKSIEPNPDGTVALKPCTLMFFPRDDDGSRERPVIMRALEGANIRFDQPVELKNVDLAQRKFVGGTLDGPIRIYRAASAPGAHDDLEITTSDIEMAGDRAWTSRPVNFRFGRSTGSGRDLEIMLGPADGQQQTDVMRGATLRSLRLKRDVNMLLEMGDGALAGPAAGGPPQQSAPPVKITCQGAFVFEMATYAASFNDKVDVFRINENGESDQLNCTLLTVYFSRPGAEEPGGQAVPHGSGASFASHVRLIEARGDPVTLRRPASGLYARCHGIDFVPAPEGSAAIGSLAAFGPGVIHGDLPDNPAGNFVAQWARELRFEPDGELQRATLRGATVVEIGQMGSITADEVFAWIGRQPAAAKAPSARPAEAPADGWELHRVVAQRYTNPKYQTQGNVIIDAPQLHAVAQRLEAVVDRTRHLPQPGGNGGPQSPPRQPARQTPPQNPSERFDLSGRTVQIRLLPQGDELSIAGATVEQDAVLKQLTPAGAQALLVKGDRLHVTAAHTDDTRVTIAGNPGYVEASGMTLWGAAINLARRTNQLWIDGPGRLTLPVTQGLDGQALQQPQTLAVDWKGRMDFQSNTAAFTGAVVARSAHQVLNTDKLEAVLTRAVDFSNANTAVPGGNAPGPELEEVRTHGNTFLETRQLDEQGQQTSFSQMKLADLSVNRTSGKIAGTGPGWITHVAYGAAPQIVAPGEIAPAAPAEAAAAEPKKQFTYLYITFRQGVDGNINRRQVRLFDRTRTVYGPVGGWNEKLDGHDVAALGPQGMLLEANTLEVREMNRRPEGQRGYFELDASGSVFAEGQRFTALGDRLTYAEEKDQFVLRGDPAELFLENASGGPRNETRVNQVSYWLTRHYFTVSGAQQLNVQLPGSQQQNHKQPPPKRPAAPR